MLLPKLVVIVTGCSSGGLGSELAKAFHQAGCIVYPLVRDLSKAADLAALGLSPISADVRDTKMLASAMEQVMEREGRVDILVNNAAINKVGPWLEISLDDVKTLFDTNLFGAIAMAQLVGKQMVHQRKGLIVNIGSCGAWIPTPMIAGYSATKTALENFSRSLRMELSPFGVNVMYVAPGYIKTNIQANVTAPSKAEMEKSLYAHILADCYKKFLEVEPTATPADQVAKSIVAAALKPRPPRLWVGADQAHLVRFITTWFPEWVQDFLVMRFTGVAKLATWVRNTDKANKASAAKEK